MSKELPIYKIEKHGEGYSINFYGSDKNLLKGCYVENNQRSGIEESCLFSAIEQIEKLEAELDALENEINYL